MQRIVIIAVHGYKRFISPLLPSAEYGWASNDYRDVIRSKYNFPHICC